MAHSIGFRFTHLPDVPLQCICDYVNVRELEQLFDVLVRQQVQHTQAKQSFDISDACKTIKKYYHKKQIASWQDFLTLIPVPTLCEALHLSADAADSHEKALQLKRALSPLQPFPQFKEEVMQCIASFSSQYFTNEGLLLVFQSYAANPSPLSDHLMTLLITDHKLLDRLLPMIYFPSVRARLEQQATSITQRHADRQRIPSLCSKLAAVSI